MTSTAKTIAVIQCTFFHHFHYTLHVQYWSNYCWFPKHQLRNRRTLWIIYFFTRFPQQHVHVHMYCTLYNGVQSVQWYNTRYNKGTCTCTYNTGMYNVHNVHNVHVHCMYIIAMKTQKTLQYYESMGIPQIRTIIDHRTAERLFFFFSHFHFPS